jgi:urease beta subunit
MAALSFTLLPEHLKANRFNVFSDAAVRFKGDTKKRAVIVISRQKTLFGIGFEVSSRCAIALGN